jgi:phosphate/sulfate permease
MFDVWLLGVGALWLAYCNGANDNFKGVATLYGSETTSYRDALRWASLATLAGGVVAVFVSSKLIMTFSGKGLVPDTLAGSPAFATAVGLGATLTIFLATRIGMPTSTTHALIGGLSCVTGGAMGRFSDQNDFSISGERGTIAHQYGIRYLLTNPLLPPMLARVN